MFKLSKIGTVPLTSLFYQTKKTCCFQQNLHQRPAQLVAVAGIGHGLQQFPFELVHRGVPLLTVDVGLVETKPTNIQRMLPNTTCQQK